MNSAAQGHNAADATVDPTEVGQFAGLAARWWDADGPLQALHKLNPTRIAYIRDGLAENLGRDPNGAAPLARLRVLDVGCGGGLLAEPLARLGARVTAVDAASASIEVAAEHAVGMGLEIDYRCATAADIAATGDRFDAVLAMEIVEHVADLPAFMRSLCDCLAPDGILFVATLNRTIKSYAMAIIGAEYVLNWVPRGSHQWSRFVRPAELIRLLVDNGVRADDVAGVVYRPLQDRWRLSRDIDVNYMVRARRAASAPMAAARRS